MARSSLIRQIIQPWFYYQLLSQEQLGSAVFAFQMPVGRLWGIGVGGPCGEPLPAWVLWRGWGVDPAAAWRGGALGGGG
ncbi:hypothetical protein LXA26_18335, partial [Erwinia amylovora]|uniref:hypothetical protein n=1 Tax=Erwinia amylovora TaxID=552 RepID=UPI0020C06699